jgi:uncharacterized membrane protein
MTFRLGHRKISTSQLAAALASPGGRKVSNWHIPSLYALAAFVFGLTLPRLEDRLLPGLQFSMSPSSALALFTAVGSGMIALTGVVFALAFVMVQFSAMAYSPRLSLWIARDRVMWHSLGVFTATFIYSLAGIAWVDRYQSGRVPFLSALIVLLLLIASVGMFIALVERISLLQINRMLAFTGDRGREVLETMYPPLEAPPAVAEPEEYRGLPIKQTLLYSGRPRVIQAIDEVKLETLAEAAKGIVEVVSAVGDTLVEGTELLRVYANEAVIDEAVLREAFLTGGQRTFDQDPKYAIRLLVDIAIRALSPAINDPTTAVQAMDQIEDLLRRLGRRRLEIGAIYDSQGRLRLVTPHPSWENFVALAFDEIRVYGAGSVQVMRRMKALAGDLLDFLPEERHGPLLRQQRRLNASIARSFGTAEEKREASVEDRQGLGVTREEWPQRKSRPSAPAPGSGVAGIHLGPFK